MYLGEHFLFTCSETFAVGCIIYPQYTHKIFRLRLDRADTELYMP